MGVTWEIDGCGFSEGAPTGPGLDPGAPTTQGGREGSATRLGAMPHKRPGAQCERTGNGQEEQGGVTQKPDMQRGLSPGACGMESKVHINLN